MTSDDYVINIYISTLRQHVYVLEFLFYEYIYIYILKKPKTGYFRIINLFPSCFPVTGVNQKHELVHTRN